jgi:hypothetical protein
MSKDKITINLDKSSKLKFENLITGTSSKPISFFSIPINDVMSLTIKGKDIREDGKLISEIEIPPLKDYFNESQVIEDVKLNIQVSKSFFTPWKGILEMKRPLEAKACLKEIVESNNEEECKIETVSIQKEEMNINESVDKKKFNAQKYTNDYI